MIVKLNGVPITTQFHQIDSIHHMPHQGIDLALPLNTPVPSVGDGVITSVTNEGNQSFGLAVHEHLNDGTDVIYGHLNNANVQLGQVMHQGDVVGLSGNTGHSTGAHLHLQTMHNGVAFDPTQYFQRISDTTEIVHQKYPWWNFYDNIREGIVDGVTSLGMHVWNGFIDGIGILLPSLACVGILWWICSFIPWSDKAPKLTGTSLLLYMFYVLIRGG